MQGRGERWGMDGVMEGYRDVGEMQEKEGRRGKEGRKRVR